VRLVFGVHPVRELLKTRPDDVEILHFSQGAGRAVQEILTLAKTAGVRARPAPIEQLRRLAEGASHQGVVAEVAEYRYASFEDLLERKTQGPKLLVVLDGIEDPHNLGAILRTADAAGSDGVVIPERRSAAVTAAVAKVSAGASEHLPVAKVTNISRALEDLKEKDLWVVGLDERGEQTYDAIDYKMHCAIVLGAEGKGVHDLVRKHCDFLVSIPMLGKVPSLNVSVAAGVVLYEVVRQRRLGASK